MILDAALLISVDRGERAANEFLVAAQRRATPLHTTHTVVAQVWRHGARQARLAQFLRAVVIHPLADGRSIGRLLAASGTSDVVDAHVVDVAVRFAQPILTGDIDDITRIVASLPDHRPRVFGWP